MIYKFINSNFNITVFKEELFILWILKYFNLKIIFKIHHYYFLIIMFNNIKLLLFFIIEINCKINTLYDFIIIYIFFK